MLRQSREIGPGPVHPSDTPVIGILRYIFLDDYLLVNNQLADAWKTYINSGITTTLIQLQVNTPSTSLS